jgi:Na+/melibiose symporter-like transporter
MSTREFPRLLAAEGISNFGSMLSRLAIPWLAALVLQATPLQMATLLVADVLAGALGALLLGSLIDRAGKRAVMLLCDGLRALLLGGLAVATWLGAVNWPMLLAAAAGTGLATVGFELARSAWMAQCIDTSELAPRNAQLSVVGSVSETAAFALGGWLYQGLGAALALAVDAASYAASAICLRGVTETPPASREATASSRWAELWQDSTEGLRAVRARPVLRALAGIEVLLALGLSLTGTSIMIFLSRDIGLPTGELGLIFATGGLGAIAGGSLAPWLGRWLGAGPAMALGLAALALGSAFVPMVAAAGWLAVALLVAQQVLGDAGHTVHQVFDRTLRQTAVPPELLARVDAGIRSAGHFATLSGALLGGLLGNAFGTRFVLWLAVLFIAAAALLAALTLARRHAGG